MGASKKNPTTITTRGAGRFAAEFLALCEEDGGLSFAVALSRLTHWPVAALAVDATDTRVYRLWCEDDLGTWCFDVTGILSASARDELTERIVWARVPRERLGAIRA